MKLASEIMNEVFDIIESPYRLKNELRFKSGYIHTVRYGIEAAAFVGSSIWSHMPSELKESMSLNELMSQIKTWKPEICLSKLCKISLQRIGYLQVTNQCLLIDMYQYTYCSQLLISVCSQMLIYVSLFVCLLVLLGVFSVFFVFVLSFAFSPPVSFNPQFKVDLNQPHIPGKGYISSIYFLFICIFYWSTINK